MSSRRWMEALRLGGARREAEARRARRRPGPIGPDWLEDRRLLSTATGPGYVYGGGTTTDHQDTFVANAQASIVGGVAAYGGTLIFIDSKAGDTFTAASITSSQVNEATPVVGFTATNSGFTITGTATLNNGTAATYQFVASGSLPFPANTGSTGGVGFTVTGPNGFSYSTPWHPWDSGEAVSVALAVPVQATTTTHVTSSANPSVYAQPVTFTASVTPTTPTTLAVGGSVSFVVDSGAPVVEPVVNGKAVYETTRLSVGTHKVVATYLGTSVFGPSVGTLDPAQVVNKASSTTKLSYTGSFSTGQAFTLTAQVAALAPSYDVPTGVVTFLDNGKAIGTATLNGNSAADTASLTLPNGLALGSHSIVAVYAGDSNTTGSTSNTVTGTVTSAVLGTVVGKGSILGGQDSISVNVLSKLVNGLVADSGALTYTDSKAGDTFTATSITSVQIYEIPPVKGPTSINGYFEVTGYATLNGGTKLYAFTAIGSLPYPDHVGSVGGLSFQATGADNFNYFVPWTPWDKGETMVMDVTS